MYSPLKVTGFSTLSVSTGPALSNWLYDFPKLIKVREHFVMVRIKLS